MAIDNTKTVNHFEVEKEVIISVGMTESEYEEYLENQENQENDEPSSQESG